MSNKALERILRFAQENPEAPAILSRTGSDFVHYSYASLVSRISDYAYLFNQFSPGARIALILDAGIEAYAAILGSIYSGVVFCPMDINLPIERISYCIEQLKPQLAIIKEGVEFLRSDLTVLAPKQIQAGKSLCAPRLHDSCYIIFTSGSTGQPKGVEIALSGVDAFLSWAWSFYAISAGERWAQFSSLGFDLSLVDILTCLPQGGTLVPFCAAVDRALPARLVKMASVNVWHSVPSVVPLLAEYGRTSLDSLSSLRLVTFCGEPLYPHHVKQLLALNANVTICNTYGPTEATFFCSFNRLRSFDRCPQGQSFPIGEPIPGWRFHLQKSNGEELEELWIVSDFLGKGYITPTRDQERFTQLQIGNRAERAYKTGDLFCRGELNELVFSGRNDRQIKVRGHRLDLSELEFQAMECGASEAKAIASQDGTALFVKIFGKTKTELLDSLSATLPAYAIPGDVFLMEQLPRNLNGKIDSHKLQSILNEVRHER